MTSGGYTRDKAKRLQKTFTGRKRCACADYYDGKEAPTCASICEDCLIKWMMEQRS